MFTSLTIASGRFASIKASPARPSTAVTTS